MFKRSLPKTLSAARGSEKGPSAKPLSGGKPITTKLSKGMPGVYCRTSMK